MSSKIVNQCITYTSCIIPFSLKLCHIYSTKDITIPVICVWDSTRPHVFNSTIGHDIHIHNGIHAARQFAKILYRVWTASEEFKQTWKSVECTCLYSWASCPFAVSLNASDMLPFCAQAMSNLPCAAQPIPSKLGERFRNFSLLSMWIRCHSRYSETRLQRGTLGQFFRGPGLKRCTRNNQFQLYKIV